MQHYQMNKEEKIQFVEGIMETLKNQITEKVEYMPEEWDSWELRNYIADKTSEIVWSSMADKGRKRKYTNTIRVTGNL